MVDWGKSGKWVSGRSYVQEFSKSFVFCGSAGENSLDFEDSDGGPSLLQLSVDGNTTRSCKGPHPPTTHPSLQPVAEYIRVQLA